MGLRTIRRWTLRAIVGALVLGLAAFAVAYARSDNDCAAVSAAIPAHPMKAYVYCSYGTPEVLVLEDLERPVPAERQVLVRVRAAAVNPLEAHYLSGTPYVMRLDSGLRKPKNIRIGVDFSGTIDAVGANVTQFKVGDEVFGGRTGALAEYVVVNERSIVAKPSNVSFEQAAAVPVAAVTALQAVRNNGRLTAGQTVLINGASGGVGTFAVQLAKWLGARVVAVNSTRNVELVRSLGADEVIDYTTADYTQGPARYDVIVDMVGNHSLGENRRVLTPTGRYVMVGGPEGRWIAPIDRAVAMMIYSKFVTQPFAMFIAELNQADLATLRDLMRDGTVRPVVDRTYALTEAAEAMRYLETGRARGKVVVTVAGPAPTPES